MLREDAPECLIWMAIAPTCLSLPTFTRIGAIRYRTKKKAFWASTGSTPRARKSLPATHIDMSARVQTVHKETNPRHHPLLSAFKERTGCPVLVNTSFNVRSEPIVCTPEDAFRCFTGTDTDLLVAGNCVARKEDQDPSLRVEYKGMFEPD